MVIPGIKRQILALLLTMLCDGLFGHEHQLPNKINLCLNETKSKNRELLVDLLELQLLLLPDIETAPCQTESPGVRQHILRQEATEIFSGSQGKSLQVKSVLYDSDGVAIMGQIEFIERTSRSSMIERAKSLANRIELAIATREKAPDPFALTDLRDLNPKDTPPAKDQAALDDTHLDKKTVPLSYRELLHAVELFIGMENSSQARYLGFLSTNAGHVVTKPFMVLGSSYITKALEPLIIRAALRGAAMPIELMRPLIEHQVGQRLRMLYLETDMTFLVFRHRYFDVNVGITLAALYFDSDIKKQVSNAELSTYWQMKQGLTAQGILNLEIFETCLFLQTTVFPFVQNFSLPSLWPLSNFGWLAQISAESKLYRSFGLKFLFEERGEIFSLADPLSRQRVVSLGTLAYLGLIMHL